MTLRVVFRRIARREFEEAALTIISPELKGPALPEALSYWAYPAIQPLGRLLIGLWLWRAAKENEPLP